MEGYMAIRPATLQRVMIKEPGPQSEIYEITQINVYENIGDVCSRISEVIEIPSNCLHLVYGGKIMQRNENL